MPALRILTGGILQYVTPGSAGLDGIPSFSVGGGDTERLTIDYTCWLAGATVTTSTWTVSGGTISGETVDASSASVLVAVPVTGNTMLPWGVYPMGVVVGHVVVASDGRLRRMLVRLNPQPSQIENHAFADYAVLS